MCSADCAIQDKASFFPSVTGLLSLTDIIMDLGIGDPFAVPLLYVPDMFWLQSCDKTKQCTSSAPLLPSKLLLQ